MSQVKLVAKTGEVDFPRGMEGMIAGESTKSFVNGQEGKLYYLGIPIQELAAYSTFSEVTFMLLNDRLPTKIELKTFEEKLSKNREIPQEVYDLIEILGDKDHPMGVLRTAVSLLSSFDDTTEQDDWDSLFGQSIHLIASMPTLVAAIGRAREGKNPIHPREDLSHAANFLYMLSGEEPDDFYVRAMDVLFILLADHGCNASTFTALVTTSTLSDVYATITAAIASLKGSLHGGANERAVLMLREIGNPENAEPWVSQALDNKQKVMGFGHRVYKVKDPRADIFRSFAEEIAQRKGERTLLDIADVIEKTMVSRLGAKGIYPNVDFVSGVIMAQLGISTPLFTPIFAVSRVSGWCAHILEQRKNNRIFRPRLIYTGPDLESPYTPIEARE